MGVMECELCGLPTPIPPIVKNGHDFCCHGCGAVFSSFGKEILGKNKLPINSKQSSQRLTGSEAFLRVEGMHCSSCEILIRHSAEKIEGIKNNNINDLKILLANEATAMLHGKSAAKKAEQTAKKLLIKDL